MVAFISFEELIRRSFIIFTRCLQPDEFSAKILFSFASSIESASRGLGIFVQVFARVKTRGAPDLRFFGPASIAAESDSFTVLLEVSHADVFSTSLAVNFVKFQVYLSLFDSIHFKTINQLSRIGH